MLQTPLNTYHRDCHARLVDFAGWEMPVIYTSIIEEHNYCRQHCALFDVSHMGRVEFRGPDAEKPPACAVTATCAKTTVAFWTT